ncbi:hypothetical protein [Trabulsiella odontotermitis]|uniref:hypothetical protein n=1 Tax=Trabulsiella odontotermitis TaxID=379893 RepID=UPI000A5DBD0C|nr:hypothetical protein [Trabulsiella odontotermitis]
MSRLPSKEIYAIPDWMRQYLPLFNNTGGNDIEALLHDDSTTPLANVVRYMLIVSVRSQFDLLVMLRKSWLEAMEVLDGVSLTEVYRSAYEDARHEGLVNWEAATSLAEENESLKRKLEDAEKRIAEQSDYFSALVAMARKSADKAMRKYPQPNYVLLKVAEEAGEVVQAGVHYAENRMTWDEVEGEIVQLLAMLIRLVTEGDQINGVTPPQSVRSAGVGIKES